MTATTTTSPNGNATSRTERKSLASQIDRLDEMLTGLSDSLNESVAAAVQGAVRQAVAVAVQAAVREVLTHPDVLESLRATAIPVPATTHPALSEHGTFARMGQTLKDWVSSGLAWATSAVSDAWSATKACCAEVKDRATRAGDWLRSAVWLVVGLLYALRKPVLVAAAVGVTVALTSYFAGPVIASALSGLEGMGLTLGTMLVAPWWRGVAAGRPVVPAGRGVLPGRRLRGRRQGPLPVAGES
jgi:hypothetical protein